MITPAQAVTAVMHNTSRMFDLPMGDGHMRHDIGSGGDWGGIGSVSARNNSRNAGEASATKATMSQAQHCMLLHVQKVCQPVNASAK